VEGLCSYQVDLLDVFYQSAFQQERQRLVSMKGSNNVICDLFADLFFAIMMAKTNKSRVISNTFYDNERLAASYKANVQKNQVSSFEPH
jgi:tRNA G37 N-methylase Trm5